MRPQVNELLFIGIHDVTCIGMHDSATEGKQNNTVAAAGARSNLIIQSTKEESRPITVPAASNHIRIEARVGFSVD